MVGSLEKFRGAPEDGVEHRARQSSGEGVLLTWMVAAKHPLAVIDADLGAMAEPRFWRDRFSGGAQERDDRIEADLAKTHEDPCAAQQAKVLFNERPAGGEFRRCRCVVGRGAAARGGDKAIVERQSVTPVNGCGTVGKPERMERFKKPLTAAIPGEHPSGSVRAMGRWGKPDDDETGVVCAEARDGPPPIVFVLKAPGLGPGDRFPPSDKARTSAAADDRLGVFRPRHAMDHGREAVTF